MNKLFRIIFTLISFLLITNNFCQDDNSITLKNGLVIKLGKIDANKIITPNGIIASLETNSFTTPSENSEVVFEGKSIGKWQQISTDDKGWIQDDSLRNSYIFYNYNSPDNDIILLEAMGNERAYVNGIAYSGNPYRYQDGYEPWEPRFDYSLLPVKVKKGNNDFIFECNRGMLKVKIHPNKKGIYFNQYDLTSPDLIVNQNVDTYGSISIINATESLLENLEMKTYSKNSKPEYEKVSSISPLSIYKIPFQIKLPIQKNIGELQFMMEFVQIKNNKETVLANHEISLKVVNPENTHKETFLSKMDGSVQYYAVNPPRNLNCKPSLFLSLHGAGVEAINQAGSYDHKNWGYIVAPTNRRPYGYNWENWGRLDALEVLDIAKKEFNIDNHNVYLTGHSMGGHGTWQVGENYSDQFAAIGPSAGWISIWSYRISNMKDSSDVKKMLVRSTKQSDTYAFTTNLKSDGIYIIHGELDDNVFIDQSESIVKNLEKFHKDYIFYRQPGAGHWWDNSDEPGADCVDWMPMFDFFSHHIVPGKEKVKIIDYVTANLAVSSKNNWIEILNQTEQQKMSKINIRLVPGDRKFIGTTNNIEFLSIDASVLNSMEPVNINLDDQKLDSVKIPPDQKIFLKKINSVWSLQNSVELKNKNPKRCGIFREVLNYDVIFVYGTHGNFEENRWAFEKARFDAEKIWYQGNGSIEIIKDDEFNPTIYKDRSVVLFGNSETNSAWKYLLKNSPVNITNNKITVAGKEYVGKDIACLMIRPRTDSDVASVAVVSGTGLKGMEISNFANYFHPYLSFPDITIYNSDILKSDEDGVLFTGFFGNDWTITNGEFVKK
jgi:hypothetical protein